MICALALLQTLHATDVLSCIIKANTNVLHNVLHNVLKQLNSADLNLMRVQTSRAVVGTEIQTCRNIKTSICVYNFFLVDNIFSGSFHFLLHEDPTEAYKCHPTSYLSFSLG